MVKLPQVAAVVRARSAAGLSPLAFELETLGLVIAVTYGFLMGLPFSAFGETVVSGGAGRSSWAGGTWAGRCGISRRAARRSQHPRRLLCPSLPCPASRPCWYRTTSCCCSSTTTSGAAWAARCCWWRCWRPRAGSRCRASCRPSTCRRCTTATTPSSSCPGGGGGSGEGSLGGVACLGGVVCCTRCWC